MGFLLQGAPSGLQILPIQAAFSPRGGRKAGTPSDLHPMTRDEFDALPEEEQQRLHANHDQVQAAINRMLPQIRALEEDARARVRRLDREVARTAIGHLSENILAEYAAQPPAVEYLHALTADIIAHADVLGKPPDESTGSQEADPDPDTLTVPADEEDEVGEQQLTRHREGADADSSQGSGVPLDEDLRVRPTLARCFVATRSMS